MAGGGLSPEVRRFIDRHLDSALELEILLLLHHQARAMTATEVATTLRADAVHVQRTFDGFAAGGLVQLADDGASLTGGRRTRAVAAVAKAHETHRVAVIQAIFSKPSEAVRGFADAFRLRDEEDDDE